MAYADGLYYERHGAGDPLLLITGWTISSAVFEPVLDLYSQHFECITVRPPGLGALEGLVAPDDGRARQATPRVC